jgi:hypothetical protein
MVCEINIINKKINSMKWNKHIKKIALSIGLVFACLSQTTWAQPTTSYFLSEKMTIGANLTLIHGSLTIGSTGELFFGCFQLTHGRNNSLYKVGDFEGETGAKIYLSVANNNNHGFFGIAGTATGSTEIILDMFDDWDGSRIELVRAHKTGSDIDAFTMQDIVSNNRLAYLKTDTVGNDRVWYLAEWIEPDDCLPVIVQKRNNTLVIDNNPETNGGFNFVYYHWFRNDEMVHRGALGTGLGGVFNVGRGALCPFDTYHAILRDQYGVEHRTCPFNPTIFVTNTNIIAYPNPAPASQSLVVIDVETDDEELLINGTIIVYNILGIRVAQTRTNGHRLTPVQLPPATGTYLFHFISGDVQEVIRVVVH